MLVISSNRFLLLLGEYSRGAWFSPVRGQREDRGDEVETKHTPRMSQHTTAGETLVPQLGEYRGVPDPACGALWSGGRVGGVMTYDVGLAIHGDRRVVSDLNSPLQVAYPVRQVAEHQAGDAEADGQEELLRVGQLLPDSEIDPEIRAKLDAIAHVAESATAMPSPD